MSDDEMTRLLAGYIADEVAATRPPAPPAPDEPIITSGLVDSLGLFKLIAFLEEKFGVRIAPEEIVIENFATVRAIVAMVQARR